MESIELDTAHAKWFLILNDLVQDYLLQSPGKWQWSVHWLKQKIEQSYWSPHSDLSNEDSNTRIFQRTTSAQVHT